MKSTTACLTGHRPKLLPWGYDESKENCIRFKLEVKKIFEGAIKFGIKTFLTGMAEGFDMLATEILLELRKTHNIKIVAIVPCLNQEIKWKQSQQERYRTILHFCNKVLVLQKEYTTDCMNKRNKFMVENCCVCIACYNGKPSGTGNTIKFAKERGNRIRIINPENFK